MGKKWRTYDGLKSCVFNMYKKGAKRRGHEFTLDRETFLRICQKPCAYCGQKPNLSAAAWSGSLSSEKDFFFNGLDRIDNDKGYTEANVNACCSTCNYLKGKLSLRELIDHILKMLPKLWKMELK